METAEKNPLRFRPKARSTSPFQSQLNFLHIILAVVFRIQRDILIHTRVTKLRLDWQACEKICQ